jgi:hypothetical protein
MLGEARMKKTREMRPVGDLADIDQIYEAEDRPVGFPAVASKSMDMNKITAEVEASRNIGIADQSKHERTVTKSKASTGLTASGCKTNKPDQNVGGTRARCHRNPANWTDGQTKVEGPRKEDKYSKSPDEYLDGK